jgi:transcriptional regulator with XRE-family HTH domain
MQTEDHFQDFVSDPKRRRIYEREALAFEAAELISELMEEQGVSKTKLAELAGTSKSHITQLLSGSRNMTMHTLADLAFVLGHKVGIKADPLSAVTKRSMRRPVRRRFGSAGPSEVRQRKSEHLVSLS